MEYKIMTREELEYMMIDLHVICLMKDEEIKTLKESINDLNNELEKIINENEQLRKDNNEAVLSLAKEKAELKDLLVDREKQIKNWKKYYRILHAIKTEQVKENEQLKNQIDELIYENSELGKFNIHMYVREQEKLMRENEQLKKQIDDLSDTCSEQLETIAMLQKTKNKQAETIRNHEARILIKDTHLENLEKHNKRLKYDCEQLHKIIEEKRVKIVDYINEKELLEKDLDIQINTIKQLDKRLEIVKKDNRAYELKIKELEQKILDEQLDRVVECTKCKTNPPCECDTESKPKFDDSVDCRPRKQ